MRILNEKRRIFGIINPVDLLVLLALLAVIGGVAWKTVAEPAQEEKVVMTTVTYTVRVRNISLRMLDEITRQKELDPRLFSDSGVVPGAQIVSIRTDASVSEILTDAGEMVPVVDEKRADILFTMEALVPRDVLPIKVGSQTIKTGLSHVVKTRRLDYTGTIETVIPNE